VTGWKPKDGPPGMDERAVLAQEPWRGLPPSKHCHHPKSLISTDVYRLRLCNVTLMMVLNAHIGHH
jgi:hypothetical protein